MRHYALTLFLETCKRTEHLDTLSACPILPSKSLKLFYLLHGFQIILGDFNFYGQVNIIQPLLLSRLSRDRIKQSRFEEIQRLQDRFPWFTVCAVLRSRPFKVFFDRSEASTFCLEAQSRRFITSAPSAKAGWTALSFALQGTVHVSEYPSVCSQLCRPSSPSLNLCIYYTQVHKKDAVLLNKTL